MITVRSFELLMHLIHIIQYGTQTYACDRQNSDDDSNYQQSTPVGAGKVSAVDVGTVKAEDNQENKSNNGDRKQQLQTEIGPAA